MTSGRPRFTSRGIVVRIASLGFGVVLMPFGGPAAAPAVLAAPLAPTAIQGPGSITAFSSVPAPTTVTIAAAGDIACDPLLNRGAPTDCDQAATANLVGQLHPNAVVTLGDNQYKSNTLAQYNAVFGPTWGKYKSILFPTIGNHEYLTPGAAGYFAYFGHFPAWYSFNLGDWHLVSLDSECHFAGGCYFGSRQETWLRADLAANPRPCTLVMWHEPRWSSGHHGNATQMTDIWIDLVKAHVDVVLNGHDHDYERFVPLGATGLPDRTGPTEFVVGTGGKNHEAFSTGALAGEVTRNDFVFGVLSMSLGPTGYSWRFVPAPGYSYTDSGSAACH